MIEMIHPASDCFVRNCNSALREQIFDVTKAEREPEIEPDRLVNDLRREPISGVADFRHALWLPSRRRRDNALCRLGVASRLDDFFEDISVLIDRSPQPMRFAADGDDDLVEAPDI